MIYNADSTGSPSAAWNAGVYLTFDLYKQPGYEAIQVVRLQRKQEMAARRYLKSIAQRFGQGKASNLDVVEAFQAFYTNEGAMLESM